mmetsp:Transcript_9464/g.22315  ORF Transcript_9464/g.22315 Transcript_9464/m.22315 type:complete len:263 (-) Transcript_9464:174-962(-)
MTAQTGLAAARIPRTTLPATTTSSPTQQRSGHAKPSVCRSPRARVSSTHLRKNVVKSGRVQRALVLPDRWTATSAFDIMWTISHLRLQTVLQIEHAAAPIQTTTKRSTSRSSSRHPRWMRANTSACWSRLAMELSTTPPQAAVRSGHGPSMPQRWCQDTTVGDSRFSRQNQLWNQRCSRQPYNQRPSPLQHSCQPLRLQMLAQKTSPSPVALADALGRFSFRSSGGRASRDAVYCRGSPPGRCAWLRTATVRVTSGVSAKGA